MAKSLAVRALAGVLVATVLAISAGCSPSSSQARGQATVRYWAVTMAPTLADDTKILNRELSSFTKQTGVKVDLEIIGWSDLYTRIMAAVAGGQGPDVVDIGNTWSPTLQATGAFLPFDDEAMTAIGGADRFVDSALSATGAPGQPPVSIPLLGQAYGLFYNTKMFAAAGISRPPATWAEFVADAKLLTKPGQWGVSLLGASAAGNAHLAFILGRQEGAQLFDAGRPQFATAGTQAAVGRLIDLMTTDKVIDPSDAEASGLNDSLAKLAQGKAAMAPFQSAGRGYFESVGFDDYAVAPLPAPSPLPVGGVAVQSFVAGTNVAVFKDAPHRDAALRLVGYLTSDAEQVALNKAYGTLPVVAAAYQDPAFADPVTRTFGEILREHSETMPMVADEGQMESVLGSAINELWAKAATGRLTDSEIAAALAKATDRMSPASG